MNNGKRLLAVAIVSAALLSACNGTANITDCGCLARARDCTAGTGPCRSPLVSTRTGIPGAIFVPVPTRITGASREPSALGIAFSTDHDQRYRDYHRCTA